jgi:hypothetical protein
MYGASMHWFCEQLISRRAVRFRADHALKLQAGFVSAQGMQGRIDGLYAIAIRLMS